MLLLEEKLSMISERSISITEKQTLESTIASLGIIFLQMTNDLGKIFIFFNAYGNASIWFYG